MTDTQILTLVLTLLGIMAGSWFNSSRTGDVSKRIDDMRDLVRAELKAETGALRAELKAETGSLRADMRADRAETKGEFADIRHRLEKIDDNIARVLADHEHRLTVVEGKNG